MPTACVARRTPAPPAPPGPSGQAPMTTPGPVSSAASMPSSALAAGSGAPVSRRSRRSGVGARGPAAGARESGGGAMMTTRALRTARDRPGGGCRSRSRPRRRRRSPRSTRSTSYGHTEPVKASFYAEEPPWIFFRDDDSQYVFAVGCDRVRRGRARWGGDPAGPVPGRAPADDDAARVPRDHGSRGQAAG